MHVQAKTIAPLSYLDKLVIVEMRLCLETEGCMSLDLVNNCQPMEHTGYRPSSGAPLVRRRDVEADVFPRQIHANVVFTARLSSIPSRQILSSGAINLIILMD